MISSEELAEAKRVAEAARSAVPYDWEATDGADVTGRLDNRAVVDVAHVNPFDELLHSCAEDLAKHIAHFNPSFCLRLLEENERMREALEREKHGTEAGRLFVEFVLRHTMPERARAISHAELYSIISNHPTARSALRGELSG